MDRTPPIYVLYPTWYQTTPKYPSDEGGQLSDLIIFFIAFAALIAFLLMLFLIVIIYNFCRYGSCCPPSGYGSCCGPCCAQPTEVQVLKPSSVIVQSTPCGSYIGRGTRLHQGNCMVEPRSVRVGTTPHRRNSVILVGQSTLSRRQVIQTVRPQIFISDSVRVPNIGCRSLLALPAPESSSNSVVRCFTRNEPITSGGYLNDDGDVRVIVRNQPYAASQCGTIIEAPLDVTSCISPLPAFDNFTIRKTGGMEFAGGGGGCGLGQDQGMGGNYGYGFSGQHSATIDVCMDQVPEYTSDDGIQQFNQTSIYPSLGRSNCY